MSTYNIRIGGEAGQGLASIGNILLKALAKEGWYLFAHQDYESRIRGGHNYFQFRLSDQPVYSLQQSIDLLVALDQATIPTSIDQLNDGGFVIYDPSLAGEHSGSNFVPVPFVQVTKDQNQPEVMANAAAAGAIWALLAESTAVLEEVLAAMFAAKGEEIVAGNRQVAQAGFRFVQQRLGTALPKPAKPGTSEERMILKGNEALPAGALAAGLKFMSAYPMTPSTGITEFVAAHSAECSVVMEQAEDEIAAVNMAVGASFAGARAMTATSGGGFALMTEGLGVAAATETPLVVINAQRPGPSTGLPTRTEQGDLLLAYAASFGDFPKLILAPGDVEEAFYLMPHAFNMAEKYQIPVIVLSDQHLADSYQTVAPLDPTRITIDRGLVVKGPEAGADYRRYQLTDSGISPRLYPGFGEGLVVAAGDEHDEEGHLIEDAEMRRRMMEKRMRKQTGLQEEALPPVVFGLNQAATTLVSFGSTKGALREAVQELNDRGQQVRGIHLAQVYPLPAELGKLLTDPAQTYVVESNYSGQLAHLLAAELGFLAGGAIRRYDGRPLDPNYIINHLRGGVS